MINEAAAKLWPLNQDPISKQITVDVLTKPGSPEVLAPTNPNPAMTIVGIMGDTRNQGLRDVTVPSLFVPYTLLAPPTRRLAIRTIGDPLNILNAVRERVRELDKELPLGRPITLQEVLGFETVEPRFNMALFGCFAGLGLALAAAGIYSVISYDVAQGTYEIGVRFALGASRGDVLLLVLRMVARVAALGLIIGLCGSVALEHVVRFQVFASTTFDLTSAIGLCSHCF